MQDFEKNQSVKEVKSGTHMKDFFEACLSKWYWFVISIVTMTVIAFAYTQSTTQIFSSNAFMVINTDDNNGKTGLCRPDYLCDAQRNDRQTRYLQDLNRMYKDNKTANPAILLTDINVSSKHYSYGYGDNGCRKGE